MTDISQPEPPRHSGSAHNSPHLGGLTVNTNTIFEEEDDGEISCICHYNHDDGLTVLCEECNTWQHIECYYPNQDVPEIHHCVNCQPRFVDAKAAINRQKPNATSLPNLDKKAKKPPQPKTQKKKPKDNLLQNGIQISNHDRASASPHDGPPSKRPKTTHRASSSTTSIPKDVASNHSRKRGNSFAVNAPSPTKTSIPPIINGHDELFTSEFLQLYDNEHTKTESNSFSSLSVSNDMSTWLNDSDQFFSATGKTQNEVLKRWDQAWEDLENASPGYSVKLEEDKSIISHGKHPKFQFVTINNTANPGSYIGEINGQIGRLSDYREDPANKWEYLLHPEPFVYFHPDLPLYIDTRNEGSDLRYVRRSCAPNSKIDIIIVGQAYHFCLVTDKEVELGDEITIGWTFEERFRNSLRPFAEKKALKADDATHIKRYLTNLRANFGGCACRSPPNGCLLERMLAVANKELIAQPLKVGRKKGRKPLTQISPLSTGRATNSRAGSESVNQMDIEDEMDSRSASGSTSNKASSRDNTPATLEASIGLGVELSTREQRKLQQQERLFEKMENEKVVRKRNSAGSALNTPNINSSKRLGHDFPNPSPISMTNGNKILRTKPSMPNGIASHSRQVRRTYCDISTQTEGPIEEIVRDEEVSAWRKARGCSYASRLLKRAKLLREQKETSRSPSSNGFSPTSFTSHRMQSHTQTTPRRDMPPPPLPIQTSKSTSPVPKKMEHGQESNDVQMKDADSSSISSKSPEIEQKPIISSTLNHTTSNSDVTPLEPPQSLVEKHVPHDDLPLTSNVPLTNSSHLQSPTSITSSPSSPMTNGIVSSASTSASTPTAPLNSLVSPNLPSPVVTSIATTILSHPPSLISPSLPSPAVPSPIKKKLSLSDWTNRNKKKAQEAATKGTTTSSPLSARGGSVLEEKEASIEDTNRDEDKDKENSHPDEDHIKEEKMTEKMLSVSITNQLTTSEPDTLEEDKMEVDGKGISNVSKEDSA